jgi:hypothetical protein
MDIPGWLKRPLTVFIVLQMLDLATTLAAMAMGGNELNPLVRQMFALGPLSGLLLAKLIPVGLVLVLSALGKNSGIRKANWAFTAIVMWNLTIIVRLSVAVTA